MPNKIVKTPIQIVRTPYKIIKTPIQEIKTPIEVLKNVTSCFVQLIYNTKILPTTSFDGIEYLFCLNKKLKDAKKYRILTRAIP